MIEEKEVVVNGRKYRITQWAPTIGLTRLFETIKHFGPLFGTVLNVIGKIGEKDNEQEKAISDAMTSFSAIDPAALSSLMVNLTSGIFAIERGVNIDPDMYFNDYPGDLFPLALHSMKIQYLRFLPEAAQKFLKNPEAALKSLQGLISTGISSDRSLKDSVS